MIRRLISIAKWRSRASAMAVLSMITGCASIPPHEASRSFPLSSSTSSPTEPARHMAEGSDWVQRRYQQIASDLDGAVDLKKVRVLLVGDSITQYWVGERDARQAEVWRNTFADPNSENYALNLGVSGDRTENVLLRLMAKSEGGFGELDDARIQPEIIVLMIGINNAWVKRPQLVSEIAQGQAAIIERLHALRPQARLIVNSVLPIAEDARNASVVVPVNRLLKAEVAQRSYASWLDLYPSYLKADGSLNASLFTDGVHLNASGYAVWRAALLPKLEDVRRGTRS